jgi:hypothetical protein
MPVVKKWFDSALRGDRYIDSKHSKEFFELRIDDGRDEASKANLISHIFFENKTNLPIKFKYYVQTDDGRRTLSNDTHVKWQEQDLLYVPIHVKGTRSSDFLGPEGQKWTGNYTREVTLQWLMVNQPVAENLMNPALLDNDREFRDFLNPAKHGASEVFKEIEKMEKAKKTQ